MTSTSLKTIIGIILTVIIVDVFCGDITNTRQTNLRQDNQNSEQKSSVVKSTTPWPFLGQRNTVNPNLNNNNGRTSRPATQNPKKWIQQNNIWIKNEQMSSGSLGVPLNTNTNRQGVRGTPQQNRVAANAVVTSSSKPPLNRGDTYTVLKPQIPSILPTSKPMTYAGAVGPKIPSPTEPKTVPLSLPLNPAGGNSKKDAPSSTGPVRDNVEDLDTNENADASTDSTVTDDELREFAETLLRKDTNNAMKYVTLNLQGMTTSRSSRDEAPLPLLKIDKAAYQIPSIEKIVLLYNNYFLESSQNEVYTGQERIEENNLLDTVLATPVMQFARSFLVQKGKLGKDPKEFRDLLRQIWFNMYSRGGGRIGSSGFEHIFLGEIKNSQVSGLHNWLYFNEEESQNRANYLGYMKKLDLGEKGAILKYHFTFHDIDKPVGSMFIGTSPELEMALYSTCFILRADKICPLKMNGNRFIIRTFTYRYRGKNMIGSAFPEI